MIIVFFVVAMLLLALGVILFEKAYDFEVFGGVLIFMGVLLSAISIIAAIILSISVSDLKVIDRKIEMYQEENAKIENQISEVVKQYQDYESGIFADVSPESSVTLVSLYPELKSDTLVQAQIEVYLENNETIKALKERKINGSVKRWWLYFGGNKKTAAENTDGR